MRERTHSILIVNPFGIGDVLFALPLVTELRRAYPGAAVGFLCNSRSACVLRHVPALQELFIYDRDQFREAWERSFWKGLERYRKLRYALRRAGFGMVFDLSLTREFGFLLWSAGIRKRVGYDYKKRGAFLTVPLPLPQGYAHQHVALYHLDLLRAINPAHVFLDSYPAMIVLPHSLVADAKARLSRVPGNIRIGIAPAGGKSWGKESARKHWRPAEYSALVRRICAETDSSVVLFGSDDEKDIVDAVYESAPDKNRICNTAGSLSLEEFMAYLSCCDLLIANDGGPLHMAAFLGIKTVSMFGPTSPKVYGPFCGKDKAGMHRVITAQMPCRPCYGNFRMSDCQRDYECLRSISVEEVFGAVLDLLKIKK